MTIMKAKPRGKSQILSRKRTAQLLKTNKKLVTVVAKRKQSETALLDSETRYRRLFESAQDGILILDAETGQITDINPFLIKMLGYSYKEFLGKKLWEIGLFKDIVSSRASFKELQTKGYIRYENLPLETKDGRKIAKKNSKRLKKVVKKEMRKIMMSCLRRMFNGSYCDNRSCSDVYFTLSCFFFYYLKHFLVFFF